MSDDAAGPERMQAGSAAAFAAGIVGVFALATAAGLVYPMNHDVAYCLHCGERMLDGSRLYVDIVDMNPPLVFYLSMWLAWVGRVAGVSTTSTAVAAVLGLAAVSLAASARLLEQAAAGCPRWARRGLLLVMAYVLLLETINRQGKNGLGQREHLA